MAVKPLRISVIGDSRRAVRALDKVQTKMDGVRRSIVRPLAIGGLAVGVAQFGQLVGRGLKDAVVQASNLNETLTTSKVLFGQGFADLNKFASRGAAALGLSKTQALQAAIGFGAFGDTAGLSGRKLAKFSTDLASLGVDLASFRNTSVEQALGAIQSGLAGEAEPLRKYGVLLNEANIRREAFRIGLIKDSKTLVNPQQRVLAVTSLIYRQTAKAQGDFRRTSQGQANLWRTLTAAIKDFGASLGAKFLPFTIKATKAAILFFKQIQSGQGVGGQFATLLNTLVGAVTKRLLPALGRAIPRVIGFFQAFADNRGGAGKFRRVLGVIISLIRNILIPVLGLAASLIGGLFAGLTGGGLQTGELTGSIEDVGKTIRGLNDDAARFGTKFGKVLLSVGGFLKRAADKVLDFGRAIKGPLSTAVSFVKQFVSKAFAPLQDAASGVSVDGLKSLAGKVRSALGSAIGPVTRFVSRVRDQFAVAVSVIGPQVRELVNTIGDALSSLGLTGSNATTGIGAIGGALLFLANNAVPIVATALSILLDILNNPTFQVVAPAILAGYGAYLAIAKAIAIARTAMIALAVAQARLSALLALNPYILAAIAIVALGTALVIAYKRSENFRLAVAPLLAVIKNPAFQLLTAAITGYIVAAKLASLGTVALSLAMKIAGAAARVFAAGQAVVNLVLSANPIGLIIIAILAFVAGIVLLYKKNETFRKIVQFTWAAIKEAVSGTINFIRKTFPLLIAPFVGPFRVLIRTVKAVFGFLSKNWGVVRALLLGPIAFVVVKLIQYRSRILGVFVSIANSVNRVFIGIGNTIVRALKAAVNTAIDLANFPIRSINNIAGQVGIPALPEIPRLAKGGIVSRATLAVVGEAGPEAVIPLRQLGALGNTYNVTVNAGVGDPATIGQAVVNTIRAYERTTGRRAF